MLPSKLSGIATALLLSGCGTIITGSTQDIPVGSTPAGATVTIVDEAGREVYKGATPAQVTLSKSNSGYGKRKSYRVDVSLEGYQTQTFELTASANGWYIGGNILLGGLIGWAVVDPLTGGMWKLTPKAIDAVFSGGAAGRTDDSIGVVLLEDVPPALRADLVALD